MKLLIFCLFAILAIAAGFPKPELLPTQADGVDGPHLGRLVRIARANPGPKDLEGSESSYGYIYPYYYYPYWGHHYGYWGK